MMAVIRMVVTSLVMRIGDEDDSEDKYVDSPSDQLGHGLMGFMRSLGDAQGALEARVCSST